MSDEDCTAGREPRSVAASFLKILFRVYFAANKSVYLLTYIGLMIVSIIPSSHRLQ